MSSKGKNQSKLAKLSSKTEANLKPELKMKVVWKICDKELGDESSLENLSHPFLKKFM